MIPLKDTIHARKTPVITWMLIISNLLVLLYQNLLLSPEASMQFIWFYGFIPRDLTVLIANISEIEIVSSDTALFLRPLISSQFLHGSWIHLLSNMWFLFLFGDNVEDYVGHVPFLLFYLLSGVAASMLHYVFNIYSPVPAIGASGAVAGVMGAYFILFPKARVITLVPLLWIPFFFRIPAVIFIGIWFLGQFWFAITDLLAPSSGGGGVAFWAHVGGFIFGVVAIMICSGGKKQRSYYY